ncbi:MAG: hypothetical protein AB3N20_21425 [Rhizobiaceae bacterium]
MAFLPVFGRYAYSVTRYPANSGLEALGGLGGVSLASQIVGSLIGVVYAAAAGYVVYGILKSATGLRLTEEEEVLGADLAIHSIGANPEVEIRGV